MPWELTPTDEAPSAVVTPLADIPEDISDAVEAAYKYCNDNPGKRLVSPPFATEDSRNQAATDIRSYCLQRPAGRLTASIQKPDKHPDTKKKGLYLSLKIKTYEKREKTPADTTGETS